MLSISSGFFRVSPQCATLDNNFRKRVVAERSLVGRKVRTNFPHLDELVCSVFRAGTPCRNTLGSFPWLLHSHRLCPMQFNPPLLKLYQPFPLEARSRTLLSASVSTTSPFSPSTTRPLLSRPSCNVPTNCPTVPSSTGLSNFPCRLKFSLCPR